METTTEHLIHLKELSSLMMDSIKGFRQIADRTKNEKLKSFYCSCEHQSLAMWEDLNAEIFALGGEIDTKGTLKGAINHLWLRMKEVVTNDKFKILKNVLFCEEFNIARYRQVLSEDLPPEVEKKLQKHYEVLTTRFTTLKTIR